MTDQLTRIENGIRALLRAGFGQCSYEGLGYTKEQIDAEIEDDMRWREEWIDLILNGERKE